MTCRVVTPDALCPSAFPDDLTWWFMDQMDGALSRSRTCAQPRSLVCAVDVGTSHPDPVCKGKQCLPPPLATLTGGRGGVVISRLMISGICRFPPLDIHLLNNNSYSCLLSIRLTTRAANIHPSPCLYTCPTSASTSMIAITTPRTPSRRATSPRLLRGRLREPPPPPLALHPSPSPPPLLVQPTVTVLVTPPLGAHPP